MSATNSVIPFRRSVPVPVPNSQIIKSILWSRCHAIFVGVQLGYGYVPDVVLFQAERHGTSIAIPVAAFENVEHAVALVHRKIRHARALEFGAQFAASVVAHRDPCEPADPADDFDEREIAVIRQWVRADMTGDLRHLADTDDLGGAA